jgi:hypothetical protein
MKLNPRQAVIFFLLLCGYAWAGPSKTFSNAAKDNKESPYVERLVVTATDKALILRFEGKLDVGRKMNVVKGNSNEKFHHADNQLKITLSNEALDEFALTVGPDASGQLAVFPNKASFTADDKGVNLEIPFELIRFSPVEVIAEMYTLYYGNEQMVATEGRNLFSVEGGRPARIEIASLPVKPDNPVVTDLKVAESAPNLAVLEWQTNNRTTVEVTLTTSGRPAGTIREVYRTGRHTLTVTDLLADTEYTAKVSGKDFAGRSVQGKDITFRTAKPAKSEGRSDAWLRVKGKYIVDSAGKPFPLGGYSHTVTEYWWNEFPRFGTLALAAKYFRSTGFNACRLGLAEYVPGSWSAGITRDASAFDRYGGPAGYVKKFLRPLVDQIINEGVYVIIDWHDAYGMDAQKIEKIAQFWEACAAEFKDEPRVAMYQLLNEPTFKEGQNRIDLAPRVREVTKKCIDRIRKHDRWHIILVSDWNCGWGWATESQWAPVNFKPGDPCRQIVYSKHVSKEHMTDAFMLGGVDHIADKWNVPLIFDEVETDGLLPPREMGWFFNYLANNPRKYGFLIWVCGQYPHRQMQVTNAFSQQYLSRPLPVSPDSNPIVQWWRLEKPKEEKKDNKWFYRYTLPKPLPAGDYGLVIEAAEPGTGIGVAVVPHQNLSQLIGTWLGAPGEAKWGWGYHGESGYYLVTEGHNAVHGAVYFHALEPFTEIVLRTDKELTTTFRNEELKIWKELQLFRLNPKHQMPVPNVPRKNVHF